MCGFWLFTLMIWKKSRHEILWWWRTVLGAGTGEMVICAFGKAARTAIGNQDMSIEAAVVGIVDRVDISGSTSEEMREAAIKLARDNGRPNLSRV